MIRSRIFGLALIGLAVPFPALALEGGGAPSGPAGLTVSASLDSCGLAGSQIICKIDAGWNTVPGADSYAVSVTSPNGSVVDMGETGGQSSSVWVPYVGSGTYSVSVTAYGTPPDEPQDNSPEVLDRSTASPEGEAEGLAKRPPEPEPGDVRADEGTEPAVEEPVVDDAVPTGEVREETTACEEPPTAEPPEPPAPEAELSPDKAEAPEAPAEPEVVDTIPADDHCSG